MTDPKRLNQQFEHLTQTIRRAEAIAVLDYITATPLQQRILQARYRSLLLAEEALDEEVAALEASNYAEEQRESLRNITNHELTLDQRLDDPRRQ